MWNEVDKENLITLFATVLDIDHTSLVITSTGKVKRPSYGISGIKVYHKASDTLYNVDYVDYGIYHIQYIILNYRAGIAAGRDAEQLNFYCDRVLELNKKIRSAQKQTS